MQQNQQKKRPKKIERDRNGKPIVRLFDGVPQHIIGSNLPPFYSYHNIEP